MTTDLFPDPNERDEGEPAFLVDLDGFEGPLDLLLELARRQKVDLHKISVLALVEQYIAFIDAARRVRLELAADYLVMAAWLAYLKSRLLLPEPPRGDEPDAADLAAALASRLRRLEAIRNAAGRLMSRPRLGRDFFARGEPQSPAGTEVPPWTATLYDLLEAYARQRQKAALSHVTLTRRAVWSMAQARDALRPLVGVAGDWTMLDGFLAHYGAPPEQRRTARASTFAAMLEMAREGVVDVRQGAAFSPLWVKRRPTDTARPG